MKHPPLEAQLHEAQRLGRVGSWAWNLATNEVVCSTELYRLFGLDSAQSPPPLEAHGKLLLAEDFSRVGNAVDRLLAGACDVYVVELECRASAHETRWIEARGESIRDASGVLCGLHGTYQEITELVRRVHVKAESQAAARARRTHADQFSQLSEQIRTALNGVTGFAYLLNTVIAGNDRHERWVARIVGASEQIVSLLESRDVTSDRFTVSPAPGLTSNCTTAPPP